MIRYKLEQNKDKSPVFASCHIPARTPCPDTPRAAWATCDDPRVAAGPDKESGPQYQPLGGQAGLSWAPAQVDSILG